MLNMLLTFTPTQFKRFRADYRTLTLRFRMDHNDTLAVLEVLHTQRSQNADIIRNARQQAKRDEWMTR